MKKINKPEKSKKYSDGHRSRMKEKLLEGNVEELTDYELLEIMLFYAIPRRDVKQIAKDILSKKTNLRNIIINKDEFHQYGPSIRTIFKLVHAVSLRTLKNDIEDKVILDSWTSMIEYLKLRFGSEKKEFFTVLFLDIKFQLLSISQVSVGTIDSVNVHQREIIKQALNLGAKSIILCHNHFSDHVKPSASDIKTTNHTIKTCKAIEVDVLDHVIVSKNKHFSFKENFLI